MMAAFLKFFALLILLSSAESFDLGRDRRQMEGVLKPTQVSPLSLLDLPVFSRGDRPSSMDKTLGAIFSKVAFAAAQNNATATPVTSSPSTTTTTAETTTTTTTTERATKPTPTTTAKTTSAASSTATSTASTTSKPVFEFDTRVFDFVPFNRYGPTDKSNRQYDLNNVPGLRGPTRIRNPEINPVTQSLFPLQPTTTVKATTASTTTAPATTSTTTTTTEATTTTTEAEVVTTTPSTTTPTPTTTTTTTSTSTPSTTTIRIAPVANASSTIAKEKDDKKTSSWNIQIYGTAALFTLLGIFALSNLMRLKTSTRRLLSTSHCLSIQLLVLFLAITRSIHLLYDPYNQRRLLPPALAFCIFNVAFPCLCSALAVLLLGIFKATKLQVLPSILIRPTLWAALVAFHFALSLSIDIVIGCVGGLYSLHLASQAYFVLWSLALSLGYFAAFAPATRAAKTLQTETMRTTLTAIHIHGAAIPRKLPRPTLLRAVRVTLAVAILALIVAAFQLYGMFGVYGLPWRQPTQNSGTNIVPSSPLPMVLTPELLARYQGTLQQLGNREKRERNLNMDAIREALGLNYPTETKTNEKKEQWPVTNENFWPWWTYQFIARLLEFLVAALISYVAAQPQRCSEVLDDKTLEASKKSSMWLLSGKSFKSSSMETLSTLCCQTNKAARSRDQTNQDLSPVKSMHCEEMLPGNSRNYCYTNPTQPTDRPRLPLPSQEYCRTLPTGSIIYGSSRRPINYVRPVSSVHHGEQPYEDLDRHRQAHVYQELAQKQLCDHLHSSYYSSSMTTSSSNTHKGGETSITTPSTCTYEHLCRRGLAGYYEPQRYEMQIPNTQLVSLLAKESNMHHPNIYGSHSICHHCSCSKSPDYESYGSKPEAQAPKLAQNPSLMESYVHMLLAAQTQPELAIKFREQFAEEVDEELARADVAGEVYLSQCASTCSSESAANSFDLRMYPHTPRRQKNSPLKRVVEIGEPHQFHPLNLSLHNTSAFAVVGKPAPIADVSPDSAISVDILEPVAPNITDLDGVDGLEKTPASPLTNIFRLSSFSFRSKENPAAAGADPSTATGVPANCAAAKGSAIPGKLLQRFRGSSASLNSASQYGYSPLVGSEENVQYQSNGSLRRSTSENEIDSLAAASCGSHLNQSDVIRPHSYWLSSDLLRKHTEQLNGSTSLPDNIQVQAITYELCDGVSSDERSFPTSLSDLEMLHDKSEVSSGSSGCTKVTGADERGCSNYSEDESAV